MDAVDDDFLENLKDLDMGYATITTLQMVEHIYIKYGELTPQDISENCNSLNADFDPTTTMVSYFYNICEICNIVTRASNPISDSDLIAELYLIIDGVGIFSKPIDNWVNLAAAAKT